MFVFPCTLNPLWTPFVLSAHQCRGSRRNSSDSHVAAREKLLFTQGRALCLPSPRSFKSHEWRFRCFLPLSSPCLPPQVLPYSSLLLCWKIYAVTGKRLLVLLRERACTSARRQQRDGLTVQRGREGGETAPECARILPRRSWCWGPGKELTLCGF